MKFINAFEKIKESLSGYTFKAPENDFAIQITLSNKDCGGTFYIESKEGALSIEPYDYCDNNAAIDIMYGDFTKLCEKKLTVDKAIETEKLRVFGDIDSVKLLIESLSKPEDVKKAPVKKVASPKKAESKETKTSKK